MDKRNNSGVLLRLCSNIMYRHLIGLGTCCVESRTRRTEGSSLTILTKSRYRSITEPLIKSVYGIVAKGSADSHPRQCTNNKAVRPATAKCYTPRHRSYCSAQCHINAALDTPPHGAGLTYSLFSSLWPRPLSCCGTGLISYWMHMIKSF